MSSSKSLLKRNISHPFSIAIGTAFWRSSAQVNPTIGVASVVINPLNPNCSRSSFCNIFFDNVAGITLSHGLPSNFSSYAGNAI